MSNITLKKYGSGKTALVAFPGWIHPIENENKFLELLTQQYTVYSVCLPGYMSTPDAKTFTTFPSLVEEIHKQLSHIKEKKVYVGFSMGCRLIMELEKQFPSKHTKIFVGSPAQDFTLPLCAKLLLLNTRILMILREYQFSKLFVIRKALRAITRDTQSVFKEKNVSVLGAFDSLIGLIKSRTDFKTYAASALFIYGENDPYLYVAKKFQPKNLSVIENAGHNCVRGCENEVVERIVQFVS